MMKPLPVSPGDIPHLQQKAQPASGRDAAAQFKDVLPAPLADIRAIVNVCFVANIFNDLIK